MQHRPAEQVQMSSGDGNGVDGGGVGSSSGPVTTSECKDKSELMTLSEMAKVISSYIILFYCW